MEGFNQFLSAEFTFEVPFFTLLIDGYAMFSIVFNILFVFAACQLSYRFAQTYLSPFRFENFHLWFALILGVLLFLKQDFFGFILAAISVGLSALFARYYPVKSY